MKFEKVALTRSWKSPVLTVLAPGDDKVRSAIARDPEFAAKAGALPTARH